MQSESGRPSYTWAPRPAGGVKAAALFGHGIWSASRPESITQKAVQELEPVLLLCEEQRVVHSPPAAETSL